jgi:hypothetical protein
VASHTICRRGLRVAWCCGLLYHLQESNQTELLGTVTSCTTCRRVMRLSCLVLCTVVPSAGRDEAESLGAEDCCTSYRCGGGECQSFIALACFFTLQMQHLLWGKSLGSVAWFTNC